MKTCSSCQHRFHGHLATAVYRKGELTPSAACSLLLWTVRFSLSFHINNIYCEGPDGYILRAWGNKKLESVLLWGKSVWVITGAKASPRSSIQCHSSKFPRGSSLPFPHEQWVWQYGTPVAFAHSAWKNLPSLTVILFSCSFGIRAFSMEAASKCWISVGSKPLYPMSSCFQVEERPLD